MYYTREGLAKICNDAMAALGFNEHKIMRYNIENESHSMDIWCASCRSTSSNQRRNTLTLQDLVDLRLVDAPAEVENTDR